MTQHRRRMTYTIWMELASYIQQNMPNVDAETRRGSLQALREMADNLPDKRNHARSHLLSMVAYADLLDGPETMVVNFDKTADALCSTEHTVALALYDAERYSIDNERPATAHRYRELAEAVVCADEHCGCGRKARTS